MSEATTESLIWASSSELLDPLFLRGTHPDQVRPVTGQIPQHPDRRRRHEAGPEHLPLGELAQPHRVELVGLGSSREVLDVLGVDQPRLEPGRLQQVEVRSARGALPVFPPVGFPGPPPAPAVPVSEHRALHKPRHGSCGPHPVTGHGAGWLLPGIGSAWCAPSPG